MTCLKENRCIYSMQQHPGALHHMHLPDFTIKAKKPWMDENVQSGFLSKTAFQTACVGPCSCQTVQGQLSDLHNFLFLFLLNFSFSLFSVSFYPSHELDAEVHFVNMTLFTRGGLHSSFWIVDRKHIYIGSADMDWRSLSKVKAHISIWFAGSLKSNT